MKIAIKAHLLDYHTPNRIEKGRYHHTQWKMKEIPQKNDCQRMLVPMDDTWPITRNPSPKKSIAPDCRQRKAHWKRYFSAHQSTITIGSFQKALAFYAPFPTLHPKSYALFSIWFSELLPSPIVTFERTMSSGICRNEPAYRELKRAREVYETQVSAKGKNIINEMEADVNEERGKLDMQTIEEEIEWIANPGTPYTRAT